MPANPSPTAQATPVEAMARAEAALTELLRQADIADSYARDAKSRDDALPSVWELQNGHLRDRARDALTALRAHLSQHPEQAGVVVPDAWRPIETAPRDGSPVELWRPPPQSQGVKWQSRVTARWLGDHFGEPVNAWVWPDDPVEDINDAGWLENGDFWEDAESFTHWRPLPEPPAHLADLARAGGSGDER